jgi:Putative DNA-binding domain
VPLDDKESSARAAGATIASAVAAAAGVPDFTRVARKPSERLAVVQHVVGTPSLQENEYLEWKSGYDLTTKGGRAKTAKHLIGFANREVARAARAAEGHAYLIIGAEPGRVAGVPQWDSADIENWLAPLVGPNLVYDVHYVTIQGKDVLVLVVASPRPGDAIFSMQRDTADEQGKTLAEGTIYVRRGGKTEVANAAEIDMLTRRACADASSLALELTADTSGLVAVSGDLLTDEKRDEYLEERRRKLLGGLPSSGGFMPILPPAGEFRSAERFIEEVDAFVARAKTQWPPFAVFKFVEANEPKLRLSIVNSTDDNFESVVVEAVLDLPRVFVHASVRRAHEAISPVDEPRRWGASLTDLLIPPDPALPGALQIESVGDERTKVRFAPRHVYPHTTHALEPLTLILLPEASGGQIRVEWRATATNTKGQITGIIDVPVPGDQDPGAEPAE